MAILLLAGSARLAAAAAPASVPAATFAAQLAGAGARAQACAAKAEACDAAGMPEREVVQGTPGGDFQVSWTWLGEALTKARQTAPAAERAKQMSAVEAHLLQLQKEAGAGNSVSPEGFRRARAGANAALARGEFREVVEGPGWLERQSAKLQDWFLRLFTGMDRLGRRAPWLAPAIEWTFFSLAIAGLLWFIRQSLARQALRIALSEGAALAGSGERDAANWAQRAEGYAAAGNWREAIHCLYWAAIVSMETRRAWKPNATRTPREYLRLLRPGSEAHLALRELTRSFEMAWYGHSEVNEGEYRTALQSFRSLEASRPERTAGAGEAAGGAATLAAAGGA